MDSHRVRRRHRVGVAVNERDREIRHSQLPVPVILDRTSLRRLAELLRRAGYVHATIRDRLAIADHRQNLTERLADRLVRVAHERRARTPTDAADTLIDLLFLDLRRASTRVEGQLGRELLALLERTGLLVRDGPDLLGPLTLCEWDGLYFASDTMWTSADDAGRHGAVGIADDSVLHPWFDSFHFTACLSRSRAERAIDLCTGSGVVALHLARTHREVFAVDVMQRSVDFARFNATLNDLDRVQFSRGDLFGDVTGDFDTVTANPPYLPSTQSRPGSDFWCGGEHGDAITQRILDALPDRLRPGGLCHLVGFLLFRSNLSRNASLLAPDLDRLPSDGYDVLLDTDEIEFRDPTRVSAAAHFGNAERVEYGTYCVHRRPTADSGVILRRLESSRGKDVRALLDDLRALTPEQRSRSGLANFNTS